MKYQSFIFILFKRLNCCFRRTAIFTAILSLLFPLTAYPDEFSITLIPSSDSIVYTRTINSINNVINKHPENHINIRIISLEEFNKPGFLPSKDTGLLVPIGQVAMKAVISKRNNIPVISTLVTRIGFHEAINSNKNNKKIGAIFLDQPLKRYLLFTRLALPNNNRLGFLMSREYRNILTVFDSVIKGYSYHLEIHEKDNNLIKSLNKVMNDSDVIVALPDSYIFNRRNTHNILLSTYRKFIPLIGFSRSYIKAGALTGIYSTPELIGKQTGELIIELSDLLNIGTLPRLPAKYFQISVNNKVARSLGLPQLDADTLTNKLKSIETSEND